jgi:hypothetical protein
MENLPLCLFRYVNKNFTVSTGEDVYPTTPNLNLMPSPLAVVYLYRMTQCPHRPITGKDSTMA